MRFADIWIWGRLWAAETSVQACVQSGLYMKAVCFGESFSALRFRPPLSHFTADTLDGVHAWLPVDSQQPFTNRSVMSDSHVSMHSLHDFELQLGIDLLLRLRIQRVACVLRERLCAAAFHLVGSSRVCRRMHARNGALAHLRSFSGETCCAPFFSSVRSELRCIGRLRCRDGGRS
eukprot:1158566-Pleurochrysis_carterae.AAC.2